MYKKLIQKLHNIEDGGVLHTTLFHIGRDSTRIHLVPATNQFKTKQPSLVFVNGGQIIPLGYAWTVLLAEFIHNINSHNGEQFSFDGFKHIIHDVAKVCHQYFPVVSTGHLAKDLERIIDTLVDIGHGNVPDAQIGQISIRDYAQNMHAPHRMDLLVSSMANSDSKWNCNLKCVNCYATGQAQASAKELNTESWKKIIDTYRKIGIPQLTFTGGEPTMRDDLFDLIDHAQWFVTRLNTNGILLDEGYCKKLYEVSLDSVQITLYDAKPSVHNCLVGKPDSEAWDKTVDGIYNALSAGLSVSVNTPLVSYNQDYISLLKNLENIGVRYVTCSGLIRTGKATITSDLDRDNMINTLSEAQDYCENNGIELSFTSPGVIDEDVLSSVGLDIPMCGACLSNMATAPDGSVAPCQSWLSCESNLGNILSDEWDSIWNNDLAVKIRSMNSTQSMDCPFRSGLFQ